MNKSIRNLALTAVLFCSAAPMFANRMGTNPPPASAALSLGSYLAIIATVIGI